MASAAILAGGRASRFGGQDKGALVVDGQSIRERQIAALSKVTDDILIIGGGDGIPDLVPGCGPLGGVYTALSHARDEAVFIVACDMPYVSDRLARYLLDCAAMADFVVPRTIRGYHPLCAVYTRACLQPIGRRLAERRLKVIDLLQDVQSRIVADEELSKLGDSGQLLANVNTPAEYAGIQTHKL